MLQYVLHGLQERWRCAAMRAGHHNERRTLRKHVQREEIPYCGPEKVILNLKVSGINSKHFTL